MKKFFIKIKATSQRPLYKFLTKKANLLPCTIYTAPLLVHRHMHLSFIVGFHPKFYRLLIRGYE